MPSISRVSRTLRRRGFAIILMAGAMAIIVGGKASASESLTPTLTLGYEDEGKVDASPGACAAYVKEQVTWNKADTARGIRSVCAARKSHVTAYQAVQRQYKAFLVAVLRDRRLNADAAVIHFKAMVKACMDHKWAVTTGGHNIGMDVTENRIAAACLQFGAKLLAEEIAQLMK